MSNLAIFPVARPQARPASEPGFCVMEDCRRRAVYGCYCAACYRGLAQIDRRWVDERMRRAAVRAYVSRYARPPGAASRYGQIARGVRRRLWIVELLFAAVGLAYIGTVFGATFLSWLGVW